MRLRRGFTLIELVIAATMAAFVLVAAAGVIVVVYNNHVLIQDNIRAAQEALLVTNHMSDIIRHASNITITFQSVTTTNIDVTLPDPSPFLNYNLGSSSTVRYDYSTTTGRIRFRTRVLAWNVTNFQPTWDAGNRQLTLNITVTRNRAIITLQTMIKLLN